MSLAWVCEECATPFGPIRTYNWAVPDAVPSANDDPDAIGFNEDEDEIALEPAQDQLGSVLWNSNTVALDHLAQLVIYQEAKDSGKNSIVEAAFAPSASGETEDRSSVSPQKTKRRRTEDGEDSTPAEGTSNDQHLATAKAILAQKNILELGSGVGVLGIALSLYGGAKVAITDIKELVPLMEKNIRESAKKVLPVTGAVASSISSSPQANNNNKAGQHGKNNSHGGNKNKTNSYSNKGTIAGFSTTIEGRGAKDLPSERGGTCRAYAFRWGEALPQPLSTFLGPRIDYIAMCDALYGNPSEWPKLIQNLKEIFAIAKKSIEDDEDEVEDEPSSTKGASVESLKVDGAGHKLRKSLKLPVIVNYCEQRVDEVEGPFLKLLREVVPEWKVCGPTVLPSASGMGMEVRVTTIYTR